MEELQRGVSRGSLLLVMILVVVIGLGCVLADLHVSPDSQYCTQHPTFLSCNFQGTQEMVVLKSLQRNRGKTVNTVFVHSAQQLEVADDVCVSLVAFSIGNITYSGVPDTCGPSQQFSFKLVDSSINLVPPYICQLEMQRASAQKVILERNLKSFSVISSDIGRLEVLQPVKGLDIKVEHSIINSFEKLHLERKSQLVLFNVTINTMLGKSLYLMESSASIWTSNIEASLEKAIVLGPKSTVTLKDTDGKVSLAGLQDVAAIHVQEAETQEKHRPPGIPPPAPHLVEAAPCNRPSVLLWVIPMTLAAVEAIVIIINCTNWFPALKGRRVPRGLEEGRHSVMRQTGAASSSSYSTWYYNTEVPMMSTSRRQNTSVDKYE